MSGEPTLLLIPGLGVSGRLFEPQRALPYRIETLEYIEPLSRRESLVHYAARIAGLLRLEPPYFLGGVSMGGMMALEMSRHCRPEAVFLIASARSNQGIRPAFRLIGKLLSAIPLWGRVPERIWGHAAYWGARLLAPSMVDLTRTQRDFIASLAPSASPRIVRWALRAVVSYPGLPSAHAPVYQIHGDRDRTMPIGRVRADRIIPGGGHLINVTHAREVNAFLRETIEAHIR